MQGLFTQLHSKIKKKRNDQCRVYCQFHDAQLVTLNYAMKTFLNRSLFSMKFYG